MVEPMWHIWLILEPGRSLGWEFVQGFSRYAKRLPWMIRMEDSFRITRERLESEVIDGIVGHIHTRELIDFVVERSLPVVNMTRDPQIEKMTNLLVDDFACGRMAAEYFLSLGFVNFAYLGTQKWNYARLRGEGFVERLTEAGYGKHVQWIERTQLAGELSTLCTQAHPLRRLEWLDALPRPLAVFGMQDLISVDMINCCRMMDIRVPEDIAMLGVHNAQITCEMAQPSLSSIDTSVEQRGYLAASLLDQQLRKESASFQTVVVPPVRVVARGSTDIVAVNDPAVVDAIRFVRSHAHEDIGVEDVVRHLLISRRTLERRFKETLGRTVMHEIRRLKTERAIELLATTTLPMAEVAMNSGYNRHDQFAHAVRQSTGLSPIAYRRKYHGRTGSDRRSS